MPSNLTLAVFADVHGNLPALEAALADARQQGATTFWAAGDLTLGGPYPLQTLSRLQELDCRMILGNSEQYVLDFDAGRFPELAHTSQQWAPLRWTHRRMTPEALVFLQGLPQQAIFTAGGAQPARMVHGSPRKINEGLIPDRVPEVVTIFEAANLSAQFPSGNTNLSEIWPEVAEPLFICGHTHIPWAQQQGERLALNPGSVGTPINGDRRTQYALLHWDGLRWQAHLRAVPYDLELIRQGYRQTGLQDEGGAFARACLLSNETGLNVAWFYVAHLLALARQNGVEVSGGFPDDLWFEGERTFNWRHYENQR